MAEDGERLQRPALVALVQRVLVPGSTGDPVPSRPVSRLTVSQAVRRSHQQNGDVNLEVSWTF